MNIENQIKEVRQASMDLIVLQTNLQVIEIKHLEKKLDLKDVADARIRLEGAIKRISTALNGEDA